MLLILPKKNFPNFYSRGHICPLSAAFQSEDTIAKSFENEIWAINCDKSLHQAFLHIVNCL